MLNLFRTKTIETQEHSPLKRCLTSVDLTLLGIGAIIGAGVFVLTGIAAATKAGPAIVLCYLLAGTACAFSALSYAELATSIGGCGSAYGYAYAGFGEIIAWIIGWDLLLEYGVACSAVAIGWSAYVNNSLTAIGLPLPKSLMAPPLEGGFIDLPATIIVLLLTALLAMGIRHSTRVNKMMVFVKLIAIALFIAIAVPHIDWANWHPFLPFGWKGIASGAAVIFFAYIGFDAVSTAAEEAINPRRDLPRGILASLAICTLVYMVVAGLLTAVAHYSTLNVSSPVSQVLLNLGYRWAGAVIALGAIAGLTTVILVMFYGLTRIMFAMSRDGLLPPIFSTVHPKTHTPMRVIVTSGIIIALIAGFIPMEHVAEFVNIGTLAAFCVVCAGVAIMRYTHPTLARPFKTPFSPLLPVLGIMACAYLMSHLSHITWIGFIVWTLLGLLFYFIYGFRYSKLALRTQ